ncbi:MAG: hypothetical protein RLO01_12350 [Thalassobaculaceae bacterium]
MLINRRALGLVGITTHWIDENGEVADLGAKVGRLGEEVGEFAIHTMGWIRCTTIGGFEEFCFDSRSVQVGALDALMVRLTAPPMTAPSTAGPSTAAPGTAPLRCIEVTSAFGTTRISDDRPDRLISLVRKCREIADPGTPQDAIRRGRMEASALDGLGDDLATRLIAAWRESGGTLGEPVSTLLSDEGLRRSLKVMVPHGETFRLHSYKGSPNTPWDRSTWRRFEGATLDQVVPDRGMVESVKASTRSALDAGEPVIERCEGMIIASDGLKELEWYRISVPVDLPGDFPGDHRGDHRSEGGTAGGKGVIALLAPVPKRHRAA